MFKFPTLHFHQKLFNTLLIFFVLLTSQSLYAQISANQKKLTELLKTIEPKAKFPELPFLINDKGVVYFREELKKVKPGTDDSKLKLKLAEQLLLANKTEQSIAYMDSLMPESLSEKYPDKQYNKKLKNLLAIANLRMGEQLNCILNHTSESCIYPIKGKGVYNLKEPTRKAIKLYNEILTENPEDLVSRWLLNIACMSLGIYPDSVPKKYYIPYDALDSDFKIEKFKDVSSNIGLNVQDYAGGVLVEDLNNDNYLDFFMDAEGFNSPCKFFLNDKTGRFIDQSSLSGLQEETAGRTLYQADYNNDGFIDIFICRGAWLTQGDNFPPNSLLKNNGDGSFTDVTIESGLFSFHPTSSASWADYDNDGKVDLFIGNETTDEKNQNRCQLYHNEGDGTFKEVSRISGINVFSFTKSVSWGDYNNDGWPDLFIANIGQNDILFKNNGKDKDGKISFMDVSAEAGVKDTKYSFPAFFLDFDNDGWLDLFVFVHTGGMKEISSQIIGEYLGKPSDESLHPTLFHNNKDGTFTNISKDVGLNSIIYAMSCSAGDIDNDGFCDIYCGTGFLDLRDLFPNVMLRNNEGKNFQNITTASGLGHLQKGHGIGFGDVDNDGDKDILVSLGGGFTTDTYHRSLFENPGSQNHWINLKLEGVKSNRSAIGTKIKISVNTENGIKEIYSTVASTGTFGNSSLRREMGLGNATAIQSIEVYWPTSQKKQIFKNTKMDAFYLLKEDHDELIPISVNKIKLNPASANPNHHK